jgi:hypothetical protein
MTPRYFLAGRTRNVVQLAIRIELLPAPHMRGFFLFRG